MDANIGMHFYYDVHERLERSELVLSYTFL